MKRCNVYDIDGVLVDSSHRYRNKPDGSIDLQYWIDNQHKINGDKLLPLAEQYKKDIKCPDTMVVIATARILKSQDFFYIKKHLGVPDYLISRKKGDTRHDVEIKKEGVIRLLPKMQGMIAQFWDDNILNVRAIGALGIEAHHVCEVNNTATA